MSQSLSFFWDRAKNEKVTYRGRKNQTILPEFIKICKMTQMQLKEFLEVFLVENGYKTVSSDGYLLGIPTENALPCMVTAHMDTVHEKTVRTTYEEKLEDGTHRIMSPEGIGGDDRCGDYMIIKIIESGIHPYVIFCEDEEIGCVGANKFVKAKGANFLPKDLKLKYIIELDRRGSNDAVYYDLDNEEFEAFVTEVTGYETAIGSCSDISYLAPYLDCAAVNLSCGYYDEHHLNESVIVEEMLHTLEMAKLLVKASETANEYEYKEKTYYSNYGSWYYGNGSSYYTNYKDYRTPRYNGLYIVYATESGEEKDELETEGSSVEESFFIFFQSHPLVCWADIIEYYEM